MSHFKQVTRLLAVAALLGLTVGCPHLFPPPDDGDDGETDEPIYNNTTDPTNDGAMYLGVSACASCHPDLGEMQNVHGHAHKLTRIEGHAPEFPEAGTRAGVPNPPEGFAWTDISYVIGGYIRKARYVDLDGFTLVTGVTGVDTQWNLSFPPNGTEPGFVAYEADRETPKPYNFDCFVCHTTGPFPFDASFPQFQENRLGMEGTWEEAGVQCEACHGPGSNHIGQPSARDLFVDTSAAACGTCHDRPFDNGGTVIAAGGGFVRHHEQYAELWASGVHAAFECVTCHDPHVSTNYDRDHAIRRECTDCHVDQDMAIHEGKTFVRGDYVEALSCESCHMPFATKSASAADESVVGEIGRMGDTRTHIFRINPEAEDFTAMFTEDLSEVVTDAQGRAAVTVDFVCIRCHNGIGNAFPLTIVSAGAIAGSMHGERDEGDGETDDSGDDGGDGETDDAGGLTGDAANGQTVYNDNGCSACHGADGGSGFAPSIVGATFDELDAVVRDPDSTHTGGTKPDLTDQDLADMAAFLMSP